jgi:hypothetical protein
VEVTLPFWRVSFPPPNNDRKKEDIPWIALCHQATAGFCSAGPESTETAVSGLSDRGPLRLVSISLADAGSIKIPPDSKPIKTSRNITGKIPNERKERLKLLHLMILKLLLLIYR